MPTTIHADPAGITVRLGRLDRLLALRGDLVVPAEDVAEITAVADGMAAVRGLRAPGLGVPGARKIGTWRRRGRSTLAVVRGSGPAVQILTSDGPVHRIVVSAADAPDRAAVLRAAIRTSRP